MVLGSVRLRRSRNTCEISQERKEKFRNFARILLNLAFLAPSVVESILDGMQSEELTARGLMFDAEIPVLGPNTSVAIFNVTTGKAQARFPNQVRHRLCPGSPWEQNTITSRLMRDAACAA